MIAYFFFKLLSKKIKLEIFLEKFITVLTFRYYTDILSGEK